MCEITSVEIQSAGLFAEVGEMNGIEKIMNTFACQVTSTPKDSELG